MAKKLLRGTGSRRARGKSEQAKPIASDNRPAPDYAAARSAPWPAARRGQQSAPTDEPVRLRTGRSTISLGNKGRVEDRELTLEQAAMQWTYIVRNRRRWSVLPDLKRQQAVDATALLRGLGAQDLDLQEFARARMVEVSVPWSQSEAENWPARVLPWEYVIASATQDWRGDKALTVTRHMDFGGEARRQKSPNGRVLFVVSDPGPNATWCKPISPTPRTKANGLSCTVRQKQI